MSAAVTIKCAVCVTLQEPACFTAYGDINAVKNMMFHHINKAHSHLFGLLECKRCGTGNSYKAYPMIFLEEFDDHMTCFKNNNNQRIKHSIITRRRGNGTDVEPHMMGLRVPFNKYDLPLLRLNLAFYLKAKEDKILNHYLTENYILALKQAVSEAERGSAAEGGCLLTEMAEQQAGPPNLAGRNNSPGPGYNPASPAYNPASP